MIGGVWETLRHWHVRKVAEELEGTVPGGPQTAGSIPARSNDKLKFRSNPEERVHSMPQYNLKATVDILVDAETPGEARKAAFDIISSAQTVTKRGPKSGGAKASVTGVTIDSSGQYSDRDDDVDPISSSFSADAMEGK